MQGFDLYLVFFCVSLDILQEDMVSDTMCGSMRDASYSLLVHLTSVLLIEIQGLTTGSEQQQLCVHQRASPSLPLEGWSLLRVLPREHTLISASSFLCLLPYLCHDQK